MAYNTTGVQTSTVQTVPIQKAIGKVVFDATAIVTTDYTRIAVGFRPRRIRFLNLTDRVEIEWTDGMTASQSLLTVAAGTRTLDTTANQVVVDDKGFSILQNATLGVILASKTCIWEAEA